MFTTSFHQVFHGSQRRGNDAAIALYRQASAAQMQQHAQHTQASATAFLEHSALARYRKQCHSIIAGEAIAPLAIRWFNSSTEIVRCGHATFAAGSYLREQLLARQPLVFSSVQGEHFVLREYLDQLWLEMSPIPFTMLRLAGGQRAVERDFLACTISPVQLLASWQSAQAKGYWLVLIDDACDLARIKLDYSRLAQVSQRALVLFQFSPAQGCEQAALRFRYFAPQYGVDEDAATGSAVLAIGSVLRQYSAVFEQFHLAAQVIARLTRDGFICVYQDSPAGAVMHLACTPDSVLVSGEYQQLAIA